MKAEDKAAMAGMGPHSQWRVLSEFGVPSEPGCEQLVLSRVAEAVHMLHGRSTAGHGLPDALAEALGASLGRKRGQGVSLLLFRVLIRAGGLKDALDHAESEERDGPAGSVPSPDSRAIPARPHACGFFLVDWATGGNGGLRQQATDIFLYAEGGVGQNGATPSHNSA